MRIKLKNVFLAILLVFSVNTACIPVFNNVLQTSSIEYSSNSTIVTAYAEGETTNERLQSYKELLESPDLVPDFSSAQSLFASVLKLVSFIISLLGFAFVVVMSLRIPIDLLIVALGWEAEEELTGIKAIAFGLSSFHGVKVGSSGENSRGQGRLSFTSSSKQAQLPEDVGQYFRDYWLSMVVSFACGGLLLTGQIFPITAKALQIASVGIDALVNFNADNITDVD